MLDPISDPESLFSDWLTLRVLAALFSLEAAALGLLLLWA